MPQEVPEVPQVREEPQEVQEVQEVLQEVPQEVLPRPLEQEELAAHSAAGAAALHA